MKIKGYVHAEWIDFHKKFVYQVWPCKSASFGVIVCEVEFDAPDVDEAELIKGQVKIMREKQQEIRADAEVKFQQIEESIQKMLCLENKGGE